MSFVFFTLIILYFVVVLKFLMTIIRNYTEYWKSRSVPYIKPEIYYGNSRGLGTEYHAMEFMTKVYKELKDHGPIGGAFISTQPVAVISDLDLAKNILNKDFNSFKNRGIYYNPRNDPISDHISNIEDDKWKIVRLKLTPAFTSGKLKLMMETISAFTDKLVETIEKREKQENGSVELKDLLARFTCDVIGNVAFGIECNSLERDNSEFFQMAIKSMDSFDYVMRLVLNGYRKFARILRMKLTPTDVSEFYKKIVKDIIEYRKNGNDQTRADLMNILIDLMNNDKFPLEQVVGNAFFYFVAGYETSSTTLTFGLFELSRNQKIQDMARDEASKILKKHGNILTPDAIQEMEYIDKVIKETLRKWPPSVSVQREASEKYQVPNTKIVLDKQTPVIIPVYAIHHDPKIYENPEIFNPSRFDKEDVEKRHPLAFLSFGEGPRICPGIRFSMMEMKICMAKILTNFRLTLDEEKTKLPLKISPNKFMICPEKGVFVNFKKL